MQRIIRVEPLNCRGCLSCELRCSFRFEKAFLPSASAIEIRRKVGQEAEFEISFTAKCDQCGICARFCPYEALYFEKGV